MRKVPDINFWSPHACTLTYKLMSTHVCTTHICTCRHVNMHTYLCTPHTHIQERECIGRKCLAFENMRHSSWTTVCGFKSIFVSRPLHPGDTMCKVSSKIIRPTNIPVPCGHWPIIANRSCLPQQVSGAPESSTPNPVHFRPHICSAFL